MKTIVSFFATILFTTNGFAQSSVELTCRAQAKELALQTYSSCVTEARNNRVEEIRKNYQKELAELKSKYDKELKKMGGSASASTTKGVTKALPTKAPRSIEATPIQNNSISAQKVIPFESEETSSDSAEVDDSSAE